MAPAKCTLKDIALRCNVSPGIVSTVLNGREGKMKCSPVKRELILKTAREMEYHPNILARSVRKQRIPIIGVFLRHSSVMPHVLGRSMSSRLGTITAILNKIQYEVLFVPYATAEEQYSRMRSLIARGLLGGIVTNIDPCDNEHICQLLNESKLPFLVLGKPALPEIYCIYTSSVFLEEKCQTLAAERKCSRIISVEPAENDGLLFRAMPFPEGYIWAGRELSAEEASQDPNRTLFVIMGAVLLEKMDSIKLPYPHYVCVDPEEDIKNLAGRHDTFFLKDDHAVEHYLQDVLGLWLLEGKKPEQYEVKHIIPEENFIYIKKERDTI